MKLRSFFIALLLALFSFQTLNITAFAEEGMWPFNNVPRAEIKKKYGFDITDEWLNKLRLASVRFNNGGSGSFVSPNGLVLTNYHIVEDIIGEVSTPEKDYAKDGFLARTQAEEIKAPSLELNQLISIEDVTARVNGAVKPGATDAEAFAARNAEINRIEGESTKATGLRSDVVPLYQGGLYNLYRYKKYTDVRLVFAPEFQSAFFGGDPDNFNYPRFNIDMALVRVYENDQPVHPESYLKWSPTGVKEGSLVFVSGNPGSTSRIDTVAHLEELRDNSLPILIRMFERREAMLLKYMAMGEEQTRQGQNELNSVQNALKVYRGQLAGLKDPALIARKMKEEAALRKAVAANPEREKKYGDAWDAIAKARKTYPTYARERRIFDQASGFNSVLFGFARTLVRLADENQKPNAERLPEYTDARRGSLDLALYSPAPLHEDFEKLKMADSLGFMVELLGAEHPLVKQVLDGKTPEARAEELISGTKLDDPAYRKQLAAGGKKAIEESTDPMIVVARLIDPKARELRKRYESEVTGVERANYAKIAHALFETEGTKIYPDATFTPRLSYGTVAGYIDNGKKLPPFTTLGGLFARSDAYKRQFPYNLPQQWYDKKSALDLSTPFNFVSTADIVGGNSGSPAVNQNGDLVGLVFDGNIQSIVGDFMFDPSVNRAISVDSRGMMEVLKKIFNANELVAELTSQPATTRAAGR